jgi:hypothetical protein
MTLVRKILVVLLAILASGASLRAQTQDESSIVGVVTDATGALLPGARVTVTGTALIGGPRSAVADSTGAYRVWGLPAGVYDLATTASSFAVTRRSAVVLPVNTTLTIDFRLELASVTSEVDVRAASPMLDVRSSAAPTVVDQAMLQNLPTNRSVVDLINLTPGVVKAFAPGSPGNIAFGGTQGSNGLLVDGVNTTDPQLGEVRVVPNYNWIEQTQTVALGAEAEYGRTTGAILDVTLRSGSNRLFGIAEYRGTSPGWVADNTNNPNFAPREIRSSWDGNGHVGGPIQRDRLWFFSGVQHSSTVDRPAGLSGPDYTTDQETGGIVKLDASVGRGVMVDGFIGHNRHHIDNAELSVYVPTSAATFRQQQSDWIGTSRLRWMWGSRTTADIQVKGYNSPLANDSMLLGGDAGPAPHYDLATNIESVNTSMIAKRDRSVVSVGANVTHYADSFLKGSHQLKLGFDYERAHSTNFDGYPSGRFYLDYAGAPYLAYLWEGNRVQSTGNQTALYAQDAWTVMPRVTVNAGLRFDVNRGSVPDVGQVFATTSVSPRIGIACDPAGDHHTVIKAHYGRYTDPLYSNHFNFLNRSGTNPSIFAQVVGPNRFVELSRNTFSRFELDDAVTQPSVDQTLIGVERELMSDVSIDGRFIDRRFKDFIGSVDRGSVWTPGARQDPGPDGVLGTVDDGGTLTLYQLTNPGHQSILVTNPNGAYRHYSAVQVVGRKRYSRNWQLLAGYTWARNEGNVSSGGTYANALLDHYDLAWFGAFVDPNHLVNKAVPFNSSELKIEGTYHMSAIGGANLSGVFRRVSGAPFQRAARFRGLGARPETVLVESEVSRYLDVQETLDARLEKTFSVNRSSIGVYLDVFNLTNQGVATFVSTLSGSGLGAPLAWSDPRTARIGLRWQF